jgi:MFS family permease
MQISQNHEAAALVLWASCLAMLAIGANSTAIMAALPTMQRDFALGPGLLSWIVNAYLVASAACIILGGKAADQIGPLLSSAAGLGLFALASTVIAIAPAPGFLLAGRALQGLGAAFAVPGTLAAVDAAAPEARRPASIATWTGFLMLGFSIGPLFGGALTHFIDWRMIFWLNLPVMALAAAGLLRCWAQASERRSARPSRKADWVGFLLLATFMTGLVFGLRALPKTAVEPLATALPLAITAAALIALLWVEPRVEVPLLNFAFFARRDFRLAIMIGFLSMLNIMSLLLYYNLDAQSPDGLDLTPIEAGASLLPLSAGLLAFGLGAARLASHFSLRAVMTGGMLLTVAASVALALALRLDNLTLLLASFLLAGAGLALPYASAPRLALAALAPDQAGQGSGIINACTFLGGSVGIACGDIAYESGGIDAVLAALALSAAIGAGLCRKISSEAKR